MPDIDELLRDSAPEVTLASGAGQAMAATARAITSDNRNRTLRPGRYRTRTRCAAAIAALGLGAIAFATFPALIGAPDRTDRTGTDRTSTVIDPNASDFRLVSTQLAPSDLPLPDGVTLPDATDQVVRQSKDSSGPVTKTLIAETYVHYAQCQWMRASLEGQVTSGAARAALSLLSDPAAFIAGEDDGVRRLQDHEGIGIEFPPDLDLRPEFAALCKNGLGDAPKADR